MLGRSIYSNAKLNEDGTLRSFMGISADLATLAA